MTNLSIFTKNSLEKTPTNPNNSIEKNRLGFSFERRFEEQIKKRRITKDYQFFGIWIAQNLGDTKNIPLFIRLAKNQDKILLESAVSYIKDYPNARSRTHLFLWFLKGKLKKVEKKTDKDKVSKIKLKKPKAKKVKKVELIGLDYETIPRIKKYIEDVQKIDSFFKEENVESEYQILNPKEFLFEKLSTTRKFENKIEKNFYLNIFKFDMYSQNFNLAIDIVDERDMSLTKKTYFESKKRFALKNNLKYFLIDAGDITSNYSKTLFRILK